MEFPIGVFAIAVSTVVYPLLASAMQSRRGSRHGADFRRECGYSPDQCAGAAGRRC